MHLYSSLVMQRKQGYSTCACEAFARCTFFVSNLIEWHFLHVFVCFFIATDPVTYTNSTTPIFNHVNQLKHIGKLHHS